MTDRSTSRRRFLLGTTGLAGLGALAAASASPLRAHCATLHARLAGEINAFTKSTSLAAANVQALVAEIRCPGCGQPLIEWQREQGQA